jgi:hypothetical protein
MFQIVIYKQIFHILVGNFGRNKNCSDLVIHEIILSDKLGYREFKYMREQYKEVIRPPFEYLKTMCLQKSVERHIIISTTMDVYADASREEAEGYG